MLTRWGFIFFGFAQIDRIFTSSLNAKQKIEDGYNLSIIQIDGKMPTSQLGLYKNESGDTD